MPQQIEKSRAIIKYKEQLALLRDEPRLKAKNVGDLGQRMLAACNKLIPLYNKAYGESHTLVQSVQFKEVVFSRSLDYREVPAAKKCISGRIQFTKAVRDVTVRSYISKFFPYFRLLSGGGGTTDGVWHEGWSFEISLAKLPLMMKYQTRLEKLFVKQRAHQEWLNGAVAVTSKDNPQLTKLNQERAELVAQVEQLRTKIRQVAEKSGKVVSSIERGLLKTKPFVEKMELDKLTRISLFNY